MMLLMLFLLHFFRVAMKKSKSSDSQEFGNLLICNKKNYVKAILFFLDIYNSAHVDTTLLMLLQASNSCASFFYFWAASKFPRFFPDIIASLAAPLRKRRLENLPRSCS